MNASYVLIDEYYKVLKELSLLVSYTQHKQHCKLFGFTSFEKKKPSCTCGLSKLIHKMHT